ncbi:MAG: glycosyltransferase, partial [Candidatus Aenigmatarchaeota archaeon]
RNFLQNSLRGVRGIYDLARIKRKTDILIIHRALLSRDWDFLEKLALSGGPVVFDIDDAEFIKMKKKTEMLFRESDAVLAGSHYIKEEAERFNDNVTLLPTGIDTENFRPMPQIQSEEDKFIVGWVGAAKSHRDNLELIIEPFEQLSREIDKLELRLIGMNGADELKEKFKRSDISADLIDWVNHEQIPEEINKFDVGIMPLVDNPWNRGKCALKALEYMSCGIPTVVSDVGENPQAVKQGDAGVMVENTISSWKSAVSRLYRKPVERERLGEAGRKRVDEQYGLEKIAEKLSKSLHEFQP